MRTFWIFTTFVAIFILAVWMFAERVVQRTPELKQQPHITEVHGNITVRSEMQICAGELLGLAQCCIQDRRRGV